LPEKVQFLSIDTSQGNCAGTSLITCMLGSLADGQTATITISIRPSSPGRTLINTTYVTAFEPDPDNTNNRASVETSLAHTGSGAPPSTDLHVTQASSSDLVLLDTDVTFTAVVENKGTSAASSVSFTANLTGNYTLVSVVSSQGPCHGTSPIS